MSDIDLDLVELRCKLRGWKCKRVPHHAAEYLTMEVPGGSMRVDDCGFYLREGDMDAAISALTAPRLTLADIIAAPGDGWTAQSAASVSYLWWRPSLGDGKSHVRVDVVDGRLYGVPMYSTLLTLPEMLAAHRAVSDLLVRLGEVQP